MINIQSPVKVQNENFTNIGINLLNLLIQQDYQFSPINDEKKQQESFLPVIERPNL